MSYTFRPDFALVHVAGTHLLVTLRSGWGKYPMVMQISDVSARIWECVESGLSKQETLDTIMAELGLTYERAEKTYQGFIRFCEIKDYFLPEDET